MLHELEQAKIYTVHAMTKTETISAPLQLQSPSRQVHSHTNTKGGSNQTFAGAGDDKTQHAPSSQSSCSNKISDIHWHLINLCAVVLLYISQYTDVILAHKIDRHTLQCKQKKLFVITTSPVLRG